MCIRIKPNVYLVYMAKQWLALKRIKRTSRSIHNEKQSVVSSRPVICKSTRQHKSYHACALMFSFNYEIKFVDNLMNIKQSVHNNRHEILALYMRQFTILALLLKVLLSQYFFLQNIILLLKFNNIQTKNLDAVPIFAANSIQISNAV